jgi:N-acetylglutamate synthase-like GNAT family acetyltransferase
VQTHRDLYEDPAIGGEDPGIHFDSYLLNPSLSGAWVADYRTKVIGLAGLLIEGDEGELEPLVVARVYRNQQVGKMLVDQILGEARRRGLQYLNVRPVARNVEAIRFFVSSGFAVAGRVELFMDLQEPNKNWKEGLSLHGLNIRF